MQKRQIIIFTLILASGLSLFYGVKHFDQNTMIKKVSIGGAAINAELAQTPEERTKGLSGHKPLSDNQGMLFIFEAPGRYGFWMKDMLFPIDIIWLGSDHKIVHIEHDLSPSTYPKTYASDAPSQYVLEVNAGLSDKYHWQEGDQAKF